LGLLIDPIIGHTNGRLIVTPSGQGRAPRDVLVQVGAAERQTGTIRAFGRKGLNLRGQATFCREEFEVHRHGQLEGA
jgi:hypothetical protein